MRLEKFLAASGIASRRDAKKHIHAGRVTVNGERVLIPGTHIHPQQDVIECDGKRIEGKPKQIYLMLNKPVGYITTLRDDRGRPTVMELVRPIRERIYPVGRLDFDTEGLLLMTNDGEFAYRLTHPSHEIKKTYIVWVDGQPSQGAIHKLRQGVEIEDGLTAPATVMQIGRRIPPSPLFKGGKGGLTQFKVIIHEGKKRQIRRMFHAVGHEVISLKRIQIGPLSLGNLPVGAYRLLTPVEVDALRN
ncbi:rRNA pseudouridine synthase [Candidatus Poribacteria bacterium]|nr:rRNA pseudouridine synthase [Candidatus Poribacteria bacterium]